jgi:hypothetical protein
VTSQSVPRLAAGVGGGRCGRPALEVAGLGGTAEKQAMGVTGAGIEAGPARARLGRSVSPQVQPECRPPTRPGSTGGVIHTFSWQTFSERRFPWVSVKGTSTALSRGSACGGRACSALVSGGR